MLPALAARPARAAGGRVTPTQWLVNRLTCGWTPEEQVLADQLGYDGYLEYHLNHAAIDDSALDARLASLTTLTMTPNELAGLMADLAAGLAAFHADIWSGNGRNVTVVVMSEFGRRLEENGSLGTDHGHGNVMFVLGNRIAGGRVLADWPGLAPGQLFEGRDLDVTIDFRDILAELVAVRLGNAALATVFPDYAPTFRGITGSCGKGDLNCDGRVDFYDIDPLVLALSSPTDYQAAHPRCNINAGDVNSDGQIDFFDIDPFVERLGTVDP